MQKVGINELYKMILEEMDLEEAPSRNKKKRRAAALKKKKQERDNNIKSLKKARQTLDQFINREKNKNIDEKDIKSGLIAFAKSKNLAESTDTTDVKGNAKKVLDDARSLLGSISDNDLLQVLKDRGINIGGSEETPGSDAEEQEADPELPEELKPFFDAFKQFNEDLPENPNIGHLNGAANKQGKDLQAFVDYLKTTTSKLGNNVDKYPKFKQELIKFRTVYGRVKSQIDASAATKDIDAMLDTLASIGNIADISQGQERIKNDKENILKKLKQQLGFSPDSLGQFIKKASSEREAISKDQRSEAIFKLIDNAEQVLQILTKEPEEPEEEEQNPELEELKSDLELFKKFTDQLEKIKREKVISESIIFEELSRSDLEDAAKAAGADYEYFKNLADKLTKGGLLVKYSEEEGVKDAKAAISDFQSTSRQTRSEEEVYRDIIKSYKAAIEKRKQENPEDQEEIEARSKAVLAAMKKAWQNKDEELPEETEEDVQSNLEEYPPEMTLEQELELVESFIKDALNVALNPDYEIEMPEPENTEESESETVTAENTLAGGAIGAAAGAAGGLGWVAALGAAIPAAPIALGVALGGTVGAIIGKKIVNRKEERRFLSSIQYGVDTFVKTLAKTYKGDTGDLDSGKITKLKEKYKDILDENGKLKLNKVDKSSIQRLLSDVLKSEGQEVGRGMAQPLEGDVINGEMGETLKKFARIILYSNLGKVNESREKDKQAMLKFLKSYKKSRGRDYESILKSKFNDKERDALVYWFSDKKRGKEFVKTYFKDGAALFDDSAMDTIANVLENTTELAGEEVEDNATSSGSDPTQGQPFGGSGSDPDALNRMSPSDDQMSIPPFKRDDEDELEEALKPIIRQTIKEILEK